MIPGEYGLRAGKDAQEQEALDIRITALEAAARMHQGRSGTAQASDIIAAAKRFEEYIRDGV